MLLPSSSTADHVMLPLKFVREAFTIIDVGVEVPLEATLKAVAPPNFTP